PSAVVKKSCLLFLIGNPRRQRRDMPMHMAIPLLASQGQNVDPLGRNHLPDGLGYSVDELLERQVVFQGKVSGRLFTMGAWSDQRMASERGILREEDHGPLILINELMAILRITGQHFADETRPSRSLLIGPPIKGVRTPHALHLARDLVRSRHEPAHPLNW